MTDIINGNKLIAEFMGYRYIGEPTPNSHNNGWWKSGKVTSLKQHNNFLCRNHNQLSYHRSWDWLMPVVEKIESMSISSRNYPVVVNIRESQCVISYFDGKINQTLSTHSKQRGDSETKLLNTWLSVVYFIEWYNTQNQTL